MPCSGVLVATFHCLKGLLAQVSRVRKRGNVPSFGHELAPRMFCCPSIPTTGHPCLARCIQCMTAWLHMSPWVPSGQQGRPQLVPLCGCSAIAVLRGGLIAMACQQGVAHSVDFNSITLQKDSDQDQGIEKRADGYLPLAEGCAIRPMN